LSNVIENIDEVQKSLQKTEFSWMLENKGPVCQSMPWWNRVRYLFNIFSKD